ncbi:hypothetical protein PFICI_07403 [Pestalotiopsis fici W106-1]|uniref:AAA+ ATPase domain-containing protein n=1 Tax=Pestalotiopsis fici (strain W106-1 / CGMCC3.15140) TaxID=1229662 RepID=W3X1I1_PESFW|nr:uncharacterized protein PFICI_07403 [Pestalotiopsis fici W106-1]ETS79874.1 hypothetical protein PFICI_07403 [Pestalotiopsis fici W106-1]
MGSQRDEMVDENDEDEGSDESYEPRRLRHKAPRRRPRRTIDWRYEICTFLDKPCDVPDNDLLDAFEEASGTLGEIERLRRQASDQHIPPRYQVVHEIICHHDRTERGIFLERPSVVNYGPHGAHVRSSRGISNKEVFLERNKEITFLVWRQYECCGIEPPDKGLLHQGGTDDLNIKALLKYEYIEIISSDLREAMIALGRRLEDIPMPDLEEEEEEEEKIDAPYLWWFHQRSQIQVATLAMQPAFQEHIDVFARYLLESFGNEWEIVDQLLANKNITVDLIHYLFVPNQVIVSKSAGSDVASLEGFWLQEWAQVSKPQSGKDGLSINLESSHWTFDGNFEKRETALTIDKFPSMLEKFAISELTIYPRRFASGEIVRALRERGRMFWKCRERHYVMKTNQSDSSLQETIKAPTRFMVDRKAYYQWHRGQRQHPRAHDEGPNCLDAATMVEDDPDLGDNFFMCLPTNIFGFNMQTHVWENLKVAEIQDVEWNENAFKLLVLEKETKELVEAVVKYRIMAGGQTDVIQGKGNGLFLFGPGTGKTLTAESVAEVAKRPLYRVTCGDIGTKAEVVEDYLSAVLKLGKAWECAVVLLDEADVFLEQRHLHHLERNALVSVFLRVLEYYDGILILTSNRVGTFDAAFKSRIQLSLRYNNLGKEQRRKIWENFIERLEGLAHSTEAGCDFRKNALGTDRDIDVGIDTAGIREHLDELARHEINGREIRNAISTARQLAMFRRVPMGYEHLQTVIGEANKFQQYIKDLNQGFTADQLSNERGERYH